MDYRKYGNTYLVCMEVGEEIVEQLKVLCRAENVRLAQVPSEPSVRRSSAYMTWRSKFITGRIWKALWKLPAFQAA